MISIIIPVKNGAQTLKACLEGIQGQTLYPKTEVILIDSGSTDETLKIINNYSVRLYQIQPEEFNHGDTRNYGVSLAKGEFVVMTVQDAVPTDSRWLEKLYAHFHDPLVIGVCGQQIVPHDLDKNPHEWFRPFSTPKPKVIHFRDTITIKSLSPQELYQACGWDNVNAMYRKKTLQRYPFPVLNFAEDMAWAKMMVLGGERIVYDYNCRVYHYHHSTYEYTYRRTLTVLYNIYKNFGFVRKVRFSLLDYFKVVYRNFKFNANVLWIFFNWRKMKAASNAYRDVVHLLKESEASLDEFHLKICGLPPQGKQNKNKNKS